MLIYYSINVSNKGESPQKILVDECIELFQISTEKSIGKGVEFTLIDEDDPLVLNKLKSRNKISNKCEKRVTKIPIWEIFQSKKIKVPQ